ncbi:hypothetical protein FRC07_011533 [Ceratobasidium sp. 392]|nr:hypothetical protein FRC07_011533 [Ceratobasidium sp. 392]
MPIEVKIKATLLKAGMAQLAEYASIIFSNQLHRRHLYGMVLCGLAATFVRFDRSGILYSRPIDIRNNPEEFRIAFAGIMLLNEEEFGYDTAFTTRVLSDGSLDYYIDFPAGAFSPKGLPHTSAEASEEILDPTRMVEKPSDSLTKTMKVMKALFHNGDILGRATTALLVREVIQFGASDESNQAEGRAKSSTWTTRERRLAEGLEVLGTRDYVLKLAWRDPKQTMEGDVLERLVGIYGVAQHMWHSDAFKKCNSPGCGRSMSNSCGNCLDRTPNSEDLWVVENLTDIDVPLPENPEDGEEEVETNGYYLPVKFPRIPRTYCRLLMSTVGSGLDKAKSLSELLQAILDAVLAYWRLVNMGILHRDISYGNVMLLRRRGGYNVREWKLPRVASDPNSALAESERLLQDIVNRLNRDPAGMLHDFDLAATYDVKTLPFFGNPSPQNEKPSLNESRSKRRKLDPEVAVSSPSANSNNGEAHNATIPDEASSNDPTKVHKDAYCDHDFRIGTHPYMSTRVLNVGAGKLYEHHFMDDLESFFWLILWSIIEHVDVKGNQPNQYAQRVLWIFRQPDLEHIANKKIDMLEFCRGDGMAIYKLLVGCKEGNSWAVHPVAVPLIQKLGSYFDKVYTEGSHSKYSPEEAFPVVVGCIMDALEDL